MRTHPELPGTAVLVCAGCRELVQVPSPQCQAPHGAAHPRDVLRHLCVVLGHVLTAHGHPTQRCLRCHAPRKAVLL